MCTYIYICMYVYIYIDVILGFPEVEKAPNHRVDNWFWMVDFIRKLLGYPDFVDTLKNICAYIYLYK